MPVRWPASPSPRWWASSASGGSSRCRPLSTGGRSSCFSVAGPLMPDQLDVALVVGPTTGGIGRHAHALGGALIGRGHRVTVVGPLVTAELFDWSALGATFVPAPVGASTPAGLSTALRA